MWVVKTNSESWQPERTDIKLGLFNYKKMTHNILLKLTFSYIF